MSLAGAQASSGFVSGLSNDLVADMVERVRTDHPDQFEIWWNAGARLDVRAATSFGVDVLDRVLQEH